MENPILKLSTQWLGRSYMHFELLDSTNRKLETMTNAEPVPNGMVISADYQTQGRGRLDKKWESPPQKSLLFSCLIKPDLDIQNLHHITLVSARALQQAIYEMTGVMLSIKWVNDLLYEDQKVSGILCESVLKKANDYHVIVGIGVNVNQEESDFTEKISYQATSLRMITGKELDRFALLSSVLNSLEESLERLYYYGLSVFLPEIMPHFYLQHKHVCTDEVEGQVTGLTEDGYLKILDRQGTEHIHVSGGIHICKGSESQN